jgi:hypothetical protein
VVSEDNQLHSYLYTLDTLRIFSELGDLSVEEEVVSLLRKAIDRSWRIEVIFGKTETLQQDQYAAELRKHIQDPYLHFFRVQQDLPFGCIAVNDIVIIGSYHVLRDRYLNQAGRTFAFVFQSSEIVEELEKLANSSREVHALKVE